MDCCPICPSPVYPGFLRDHLQVFHLVHREKYIQRLLSLQQQENSPSFVPKASQTDWAWVSDLGLASWQRSTSSKSLNLPNQEEVGAQHSRAASSRSAVEDSGSETSSEGDAAGEKDIVAGDVGADPADDGGVVVDQVEDDDPGEVGF